ncbi:class D sortase [uncultured Paludibaculum sp.]|uniref:class D sortase n=1 Tax=uncultured Paludibaculum sp. TaxID=1765020 RepID=UPI002AABADCA|nr:class D sortase [uncultured Paludibaculum sp.]
MRVVATRRNMRSILRWTQRLLFALGATLLTYSGYVVVDAQLFQNREDRHLDRMLVERQGANAGESPTAAPLLPAVPEPAWPRGLIGRIEIPRLGLEVIVMEGVDHATLRRAAGHIPGTALPGQAGNVGISGHRDTFFRPLRNIRNNDLINIITPLGDYRYRVVSSDVVDPRNVAVLASSASEILTLVTCYPFYFVGPAPDRFIVRAERVL